MRMNLSNNKVEYLHPQIDKSVDGKGRAAILCSWGNSLIYVIDRGECVLLYDLDNNNVKSIEIQCKDMNLDMYSYAGVIDGQLVIVPMFHHEIVQIDLKNESYKRQDILDIKEENNAFRQYYAKNAYVSKQCLEIFSTFSNEILLVDLGSLSIISRRKIIDNGSEIINYVHVNEIIVLLDSSNDIHIYRDNLCRVLCKLCDGKDGYLSMYIANSRLWVLPMYDNQIVCVSLGDGKKITVSTSEKISYTAPKTMGKYFGTCAVGDRIFFSMNSGDKMVYFEEDKLAVLNVEWPNREDDYKELKYQRRKFMQEVGILLSTFIDFVSKD